MAGGKRKGAGRPKGSTNVPRFSDYITEKDRKTFVEFVLETYMGDMRLAQWMGDHLFAKPPTTIAGDPDNRTPIPIMHVQRDNSDSKGRGPK
jgi:hypothetical protein